MIQQMLVIWSGYSAFSQTILNIWKFTVHVLLKPGLENSQKRWNIKNDGMISVRFQEKQFNIKVIQAYAPTCNAEEAEIEWFYEDLQDLLELTPKKDVLFIIGDRNTKVGNQETPGMTGKFGLEYRMKQGKG